MTTMINGILYTCEVLNPWTKWRQQFVFSKKESIIGEIIWGYVWMRECDGVYKYPGPSSFFYVPGKQYAKNKKEIFIQELKGNINDLVMR